MNYVKLQRLITTVEETIGLLYLNDKFLCFTLEDQFQTKKVYGETRIPAGDYLSILRTWGTHHERYKKKFSFHMGMIQLGDVRNFTDILLHIGNDDDDTAGCILCGTGVNKKGKIVGDIVSDRYTITNSTDAYKYIYPALSHAIKDDGLYWKVRD